MTNLYRVATQLEEENKGLTSAEVFTVLYHDIFDFPMTLSEVIKWTPNQETLTKSNFKEIVYKNKHFFVGSKEGLVYKRVLRKRISKKKILIAKQAAKILSIIPSIKLIAITGSLAMENADHGSDIDFLIVSKKGMLWTTRIFFYAVLFLAGIKVRKSKVAEEKDKLCLNMWLDETDLAWKERNFYTAHEIAQIVPLVNKDKTYERFLNVNKWILNYWPNAVKITKDDSGFQKNATKKSDLSVGFIERICFHLQYFYMKNKISREVVSPTRAIFHPQDWGKFVLGRL